MDSNFMDFIFTLNEVQETLSSCQGFLHWYMESGKTRNRCQIISDLHSPKFVALLFQFVRTQTINPIIAFIAE